MVVLALILGTAGCGSVAPHHYDVIVRGGTIYDGQGGAPYVGDVAITGDRIAAVGTLGKATASTEIDARGLAVAPGFINMLSWAVDSLIADGKSQGDIRQGVTLELFGEGNSMGPVTETMKQQMVEEQVDIYYDIAWTTLAGYLDHLVHRGIATNVASFVGATTLRIHEIGYENREPTPSELERMRELVRQAIREGALGVGSSLIYPPAFYARTPELVELCKVAASYGGMYITHMRSEGSRLLEAIDEVIGIARDAKIPAEIYHLKAAARDHWSKMTQAISKIEAARKAGLRITADMYTYPAGATGLGATMPPWSQEGGRVAWIARLKDPATRARIAREMIAPTDAWENFCGGRETRGHLARRVQGGGAEAAHRKDPRRGRQAARQASRGGRDGPRNRERRRRRVRVLPDVGGQPPHAAEAAVGELWLGRRVRGARRRVPEVVDASARVRQLRALARQARARREAGPARGGDPPDDVTARGEPRDP